MHRYPTQSGYIGSYSILPAPSPNTHIPLHNHANIRDTQEETLQETPDDVTNDLYDQRGSVCS